MTRQETLSVDRRFQERCARRYQRMEQRFSSLRTLPGPNGWTGGTEGFTKAKRGGEIERDE